MEVAAGVAVVVVVVAVAEVGVEVAVKVFDEGDITVLVMLADDNAEDAQPSASYEACSVSTNVEDIGS